MNAVQMSRMPNNEKSSPVPGKLRFWQGLLRMVCAHRNKPTTVIVVYTDTYINQKFKMAYFK